MRSPWQRTPVDRVKVWAERVLGGGAGVRIDASSGRWFLADASLGGRGQANRYTRTAARQPRATNSAAMYPRRTLGVRVRNSSFASR